MDRDKRKLQKDAGETISWTQGRERRLIGPFSLHLMRLMDHAPGAAKSAIKRMDLSAGLYADFRLAYPQEEWQADLLAGSAVFRGEKAVCVLYRLDASRLLCCHLGDRTAEGEANEMSFPSQRSTFLPAVKERFKADGQACYPVDGVEIELRLLDYIEELCEVVGKVRQWTP